MNAAGSAPTLIVWILEIGDAEEGLRAARSGATLGWISELRRSVAVRRRILNGILGK